MRLHVEYKGRVCDYETRPMRSSRFRALCRLAAAGIFSGMVVGVASSCGLAGVAVVAGVTVLFGAGYIISVI